MSRWELTLTRLRWSAGSLSPSIWMSSLFPTILGMQGPEGTLHARGFPSVQYEVGGGRKGEEGRKREREIQHFGCTHTHISKLTCLIIVDAFPLLYLLSPVLTNRRGMWAVSWNLPSSRAVSCTAPCPPLPPTSLSASPWSLFTLLPSDDLVIVRWLCTTQPLRTPCLPV